MLHERFEKSGSRVVGRVASWVKKACVGALQRLLQDVTQPLCRREEVWGEVWAECGEKCGCLAEVVAVDDANDAAALQAGSVGADWCIV